MPVTITNSPFYMVKELRGGYDERGPFLSMNPSHAVACVISVCKYGPVSAEDLQMLDEQDLRKLGEGGVLTFTDKGYTLTGVSIAALNAVNNNFRGFKMVPPAYVQAWGMGDDGYGNLTLYLPENTEQKYVLVPMEYQVEVNEEGMLVRIRNCDEYKEGDLEYSIDDHYPIPLPKEALNIRIPLRPDANPVVKPKPECAGKYVGK